MFINNIKYLIKDKRTKLKGSYYWTLKRSSVYNLLGVPKTDRTFIRLYIEPFLLRVHVGTLQFLIGFRPGDWDGHDRSFVLRSVTSFLCWFLFLFWIIVLMEVVRFLCIYLLVLDQIHDAIAMYSGNQNYSTPFANKVYWLNLQTFSSLQWTNQTPTLLM